MTDSINLLRDFIRHPGASGAAISNFESESGLRLPAGYKDFLEQSNGGEGFVGESYLMLWPIDQLLKLNEDYEVSKYAPGITLFGSDGGGEAFAFDSTGEVVRIVSIPFIGLDRKYARQVASDFPAFFSEISRVLVSKP